MAYVAPATRDVVDDAMRKKATRHLNPMCGNWPTVHQNIVTESALGGRRTRGMWACRNNRCKLQKPREEFSLGIAKQGEGVKGNPRVCNSCVERRETEESEMCRKSSEQVQKRQRHE